MTGKGATIDIGAWLRDHGLGQYEATFRQNEIEVDILPELTEPDLEKLGVPLGHRKRLLKAIKNPEATEGSAAGFGSAPAPSGRSLFHRTSSKILSCTPMAFLCSSRR